MEATGDDYLYDANGNMITDRNKNIATITYNHLNLPAIVTKTTGEHVNYIYNAAGVKLSQEVYDAANTLKKKTDYLGEFFYENDTLKFINHEEGRVVMTGAEPEYQYVLKDHLGNSRVTFTSRVEEETYTATLEDNTQTEEQNTFTNYSRVTNDLLDHTDAGTVYDKVLMLNGGYSGQVGLAKSFAVVPGDTISATVHAKYIAGTGSASNLTNFAAALTQAFGLTSGLPGEAATAFEALNSVGSVLATAGRDEDYDNAPKGFVNIIVFDKDYNLVDFSFEQIDAAYVQDGGAKVFYPQLTAGVRIRHAGYAYVFLSNEGASEQQIGFDDYSVTHGHSAVIQQDEYYPFGLTFNEYQRESSTANQYLYNGKEKQDELGLDWLDYGARMYMPEIGRWGALDPASQLSRDLTPYRFSFNNPISVYDPDGKYEINVVLSKEDKKELKQYKGKERRERKEALINERKDAVRSAIGAAKTLIDNNADVKNTFEKFSGVSEESNDWNNLWTENGKGPKVTSDGKLQGNPMAGYADQNMNLTLNPDDVASQDIWTILHEYVHIGDMYRGRDGNESYELTENGVPGFSSEDQRQALQEKINEYLSTRSESDQKKIIASYRAWLQEGTTNVSRVELGYAFEKEAKRFTQPSGNPRRPNR